MTPKLPKTLSSTAIYAVGVLLGNLTSLLTLPINTRFLTPADYGTVEILSMILDVASILIGLRIDAGLARYFFSFDNESDRNRVVSTVFAISFALTSTGAAVLGLLSSPLSDALLGGAQNAKYLSIFAITMLGPCVIQIPMTVVRLRGKPLAFLTMSVGKLVFQVTLNLLLVAHYHLGLAGVLYSTVTTQLLLGFIFSSRLIARVGISFDREIAKRLIKFSAPLILSTLASFYLAFGDRFFLNRYWTLADVGLYGLAYKFGFAFAGLSYGPFSKAWDAVKYDILKQENAKQQYALVFGLLSKTMIIGAMALSILSPELLRVTSARPFWPAAAIVPVVVFAYLLRSIGEFASFGLFVKENTTKVAYVSWLTVIVMTVAYATLIPPLGGMGAAIATLGGFLFEMTLLSIYARRAYDMGLEWGRFALGLAVAIISVACCHSVETATLTGVSLKIAVIMVAAAVIAFTPASSPAERQAVRRLAASIGVGRKSALGRAS